MLENCLKMDGEVSHRKSDVMMIYFSYKPNNVSNIYPAVRLNDSHIHISSQWVINPNMSAFTVSVFSSTVSLQ